MKPQHVAFYGTLMRRAEYHLEELGVAWVYLYKGNVEGLPRLARWPHSG